MRRSIPFQWCSLVLLVYSSLAVAWPWPSGTSDVGAMVARDDTNQDSSESTSSSSSSSSGSTKASATSSNDNTDSSSSDRTNSATSTKSTSFDARLPAGGVNMQTPSVIDGAQYYKIGIDLITFGWNYTSLLATPTAVDIFASCSSNNELYTIAANQSFSKETGIAVWDTEKYQESNPGNPLLTAMYTLVIKDSSVQISAPAQAGYLATYNQYTFGMYSPQPATPLADFHCATCSGAMSALEVQALKMAVGVCVLTVASFTWFVGGSGAVW